MCRCRRRSLRGVLNQRGPRKRDTFDASSMPILASLMAKSVTTASSPVMVGVSGGMGWVWDATGGAAAADEHGFGGGDRRCK
jgi:hypothetical protein